MISSLGKQGGRRYGQMRSTATGLIGWLRVVGTSATVVSTFFRRTLYRRSGSRGKYDGL